MSIWGHRGRTIESIDWKGAPSPPREITPTRTCPVGGVIGAGLPSQIYRPIPALVLEITDTGRICRHLSSARNEEGEPRMLWTIFVILLVLWLLGMVSSYTLGGYIHILLVIAIVVVLIRVIQGRSPV